MFLFRMFVTMALLLSFESKLLANPPEESAKKDSATGHLHKKKPGKRVKKALVAKKKEKRRAGKAGKYESEMFPPEND